MTPRRRRSTKNILPTLVGGSVGPPCRCRRESTDIPPAPPSPPARRGAVVVLFAALASSPSPGHARPGPPRALAGPPSRAHNAERGLKASDARSVRERIPSPGRGRCSPSFPTPPITCSPTPGSVSRGSQASDCEGLTKDAASRCVRDARTRP
eukprot:scaffold302_cov397-Prasinococcus_capsulatus_cf.AAC.15